MDCATRGERDMRVGTRLCICEALRTWIEAMVRVLVMRALEYWHMKHTEVLVERSMAALEEMLLSR